MNQLSPIDKCLMEIDFAIRTLMPPKHRLAKRINPGKSFDEPSLSAKEKRHVAGLMRVNHAGEVCAQALYKGQAITAKLTTVKEQMCAAAAEETDHLAWCEERLQELSNHPSYLNPMWYFGSLMLGAMAGLIGDEWSLGFVEETERQVTHHLEKHLTQLPPKDSKSQAILMQMKEDEAHHAEVAHRAGAHPLPFLIKQLMHKVSKLMTQSSYYI